MEITKCPYRKERISTDNWREGTPLRTQRIGWNEELQPAWITGSYHEKDRNSKLDCHHRQKILFYCSSCFTLYCFSLRYRVVFPIPSMRAAASLSPDVSRSVFRIARRSSSSRGRISLRSGTRSLDGILQIGRQVPGVKNGAGSQGHCAFDGVFQLANVSRPIVSDQPRAWLRQRLCAWHPWRAGKFFEKGCHQQGNIAFTIAQRRQFHLHDVQTKI